MADTLVEAETISDGEGERLPEAQLCLRVSEDERSDTDAYVPETGFVSAFLADQGVEASQIYQSSDEGSEGNDSSGSSDVGPEVWASKAAGLSNQTD